MSIRRSPSSKASFVVASAVIAALGGWVVPGAATDDGLSRTMRACARDANGQLRVVDERACHESEHSLQWAAGAQPASSGVNIVTGIVTPDGEIAFSEPFGGTDVTVDHPAPGLYGVDIAQDTLPGVRCPVTVARSWFTDASTAVAQRSTGCVRRLVVSHVPGRRDKVWVVRCIPIRTTINRYDPV